MPATLETHVRQGLAELMRLAKKFRVLEREAMDFGTGEPLQAFEIHIVDAIGSGDGQTVSNLARWFYVTKGAVSQVVSRLTRLGYLVKQRNPKNGKEILLSLTDKGQVVMDGHDRFHRQIDAEFMRELDDVSAEDLARLNDLLGRVSRHMDSYIDIAYQQRKGVAS
jgi:DNA-binding MarR family transcriptional regulator